MKPKIQQLIRARDEYCWHCGSMQNLVIHHRMNRGMGGSKILDTPQNLILVCSIYNNAMESDSVVANEARDNGHKLGRYASPSMPVWDDHRKQWFELDTKGNKTKCDPPLYLL
jgi:hypothetical protein